MDSLVTRRDAEKFLPVQEISPQFTKVSIFLRPET
jgi:hypothetical protein